MPATGVNEACLFLGRRDGHESRLQRVRRRDFQLRQRSLPNGRWQKRWPVGRRASSPTSATPHDRRRNRLSGAAEDPQGIGPGLGEFMLAGDPSSRKQLGEAARASRSDSFSGCPVVQRYRSLYREVLALSDPSSAQQSSVAPLAGQSMTSKQIFQIAAANFVRRQ